MTSWMQERDRLMAQTLAFVQGVTGARPVIVDRPDEPPQGAQPNPVAETLPHDIVVEPRPPAAAIPPHDQAAEPIRIPSSDPQPLAAKPTEAKVDATPVHAKPILAEPSDDVAASAAAILSRWSAPPSPQVRPTEPATDHAAAPSRPTAPRQIPLTAGSEREDILNRVAAFRAQQSRISRDRQSYYEDMHAKIQQTLRTGDDL